MSIFTLDFNSLQEKLQPGAIREKQDFGPDPRFWKLSRGSDDTGTAIIRLIIDKNNMPFVKVFHHSFKQYDPSTQKTRWFIEDSPQTIGLACPVSEEWQRLQGTGLEADKKTAEMYSRKIKYITNIKVLNDPANPANNGKIFLWEFGTKLLDKFLAKMNPGKDDIKLGRKPVELYNPMTGANVMLKIKKSAGFFNYDDTEILEASTIYQTEGEMDKDIIANTHALSDFLDPARFKSYDELKGKIQWVLTGVSSRAKPVQESAPESVQAVQPVQVQPTPVYTPPAESVVQPTYTPPAEPAPVHVAQTTSVAASDDLSFLDAL